MQVTPQIINTENSTVGKGDYLVFTTKINNNKQDNYEIYYYEIRLPYTLDTYKGEGAVYFYIELK